MSIAVLGSTGTAGRRIMRHLTAAGHRPVGLSRATGVDVLDGTGLAAALAGVTTLIDASSLARALAGRTVLDATRTATANVLGAAHDVDHLLVLSIVGIDHPCFGPGSYYESKRAQEDAYLASGRPTTVVRTTQWFEFATNPSAVTFHTDLVEVADRLTQPVAADSVAARLTELATEPTEGAPSEPRTLHIGGPDRLLLSEVTAALLRHLGDQRPVRVTPPPIGDLLEGVLLPPDGAELLGPPLGRWLETVTDLETVR